MNFKIKHKIPGRIRVHMGQSRMSFDQADTLQYFLETQPGVTKATVYEQTQDAVIEYDGELKELMEALKSFHYEDVQLPDSVRSSSGRALNVEYKEKLIGHVAKRLFTKYMLPLPIRNVYTIWKAFHYVKEGVVCLSRGKLEVPVLDATAITVSILRRDCPTAGSVMFLLGLGEILEEWTHKKSVGDLARSMSLNVGKVWIKTRDQEILVDSASVVPGDHIVIHVGNVIPFDGIVADGEAMINQASMTGESEPVRKEKGGFVYAGTVVEEGELTIEVKAVSGSTRYEKIVTMIEDSEKLKSAAEGRAEHLADRLVPYTLGGTALTYLLTRNVTKMLAVLMVDFSCALKLAIPIAVLSAMRESSTHLISVKGGRFLEAVAKADTIVFDKTGTLTHATPTVAAVVPFGGHEEAEMLRLAACLEEHYPHSMANAVVAEAKRRELTHEEYHSQVQYVVAHGISSMVEGKKVIIGSAHFVFEDEGCCIPAGERPKFDALPAAYSHLYLCIDGELAAVICIHDPLRREAREAVRALHESGFTNVVMMTGDNRRTAEAVAAEVGVDAVYAEVLPEDKAAFIRREKAKGHTVIMVGDGVNDSPALSEADAGIAISTGAAIAREIADITVASEDLFELVTLRKLSEALMDRIHGSYRFIVAFNLSLITLGVAGVLPPAISALLHNTSTLGIGLKNMTDLLEEHEGA